MPVMTVSVGGCLCSARTIRSKINSVFPQYLIPYPEVLPGEEGGLEGCEPVDWDAAFDSLAIDRTVKEVDWCLPGPTKAEEMLASFISSRLKTYADKRNDPNVNTASNLSPYFHFGQV